MATSAEELTSCIVCFEPFRDPQLLPCQHTFCKSCVNRIADAGTIKCPKCNDVSQVADVKPDFRLGVFLDALAKNTEDLTGSKPNGKTGESGGKLCDLCEDKPVAHWCNDCEQWMCEHCKKTHSKAKATRNHSFTSLKAKNQHYKAQIQRLIQKAEVKVRQSATQATLVEKRLAEIAAVETKATNDCNTLRKRCLDQINQQFDDIEKEIKAVIQPSLSSQTKRLEEIKSNIQNLVKQKLNLEQSLTTETGGVIDADTVIGTAESLIQTIADPVDDTQIPTITVQPSAEWAVVKAAKMRTSRDVTTSRSNINQVILVALPYHLKLVT